MEPKRIGCLYIPDFRIQVHRHDEGLTLETPLVLLTPQGRRFIVCAASAGAEAAGVRTGMTAAQAEVACTKAFFREESPARYRLVHEQLLAGLQAITPQVEACRLGLYYLGMRGLRWLFKDEAALLKGALIEASLLQLEATAGAAGSRFTAGVAARVALPNGFRQVGPQDDARFLATMPLSLLPSTPELLERLKLVGLETLGDLAALSPRAVERRYGQPGVEAWRLARAEDSAHITPTLPPVAYARELLLEHPAEQAEGLLFLLTPLLESLLETLRQEGRACAALSLSLRLERPGPEEAPLEVPIPLGTPVTQLKPLQDLLRLKLARVALLSGVVEARLTATRVTEPSTPQGDLFLRVGSPSGMAVTLARLVDALGPEGVVLGQELDGWRPDRTYSLRSVQEGAPALLEAAASTTGKQPGRASSARSRTKTTPPMQPSIPTSELPEVCLKVGFRRVTPPRPLHVQQEDSGLVAIMSGQRRRQIVSQQGPFRYEGLWWEQDFSRDYYQLALQDQTLMMVYRDCQNDQWFLEGYYD